MHGWPQERLKLCLHSFPRWDAIKRRKTCITIPPIIIRTGNSKRLINKQSTICVRGIACDLSLADEKLTHPIQALLTVDKMCWHFSRAQRSRALAIRAGINLGEMGPIHNFFLQGPARLNVR